MNPIADVFSALLAAPGLPAMLATYKTSTALFSGDVLPADFDVARKPCVIVGPIEDQADADDFSAGHRYVTVRVRVYALASPSVVAINQVAEAVRAALHRQTLQSGASGPVSGPVSASTSSPEIAGRQMSVRLFFGG